MIWARATILQRGDSNCRKAARPNSPVVVIGILTTFAPVCSATICHGTILAWCSVSLTRISSPACNVLRA
ncbi:Uncharacterised protein [Vibrio cholerae]|nr:Uncharacterised protein [Vibrio cholerae]